MTIPVNVFVTPAIAGVTEDEIKEFSDHASELVDQYLERASKDEVQPEWLKSPNNYYFHSATCSVVHLLGDLTSALVQTPDPFLVGSDSSGLWLGYFHDPESDGTPATFLNRISAELSVLHLSDPFGDVTDKITNFVDTSTNLTDFCSAFSMAASAIIASSVGEGEATAVIACDDDLVENFISESLEAGFCHTCHVSDSDVSSVSRASLVSWGTEQILKKVDESLPGIYSANPDLSSDVLSLRMTVALHAMSVVHRTLYFCAAQNSFLLAVMRPLSPKSLYQIYADVTKGRSIKIYKTKVIETEAPVKTSFKVS